MVEKSDNANVRVSTQSKRMIFNCLYSYEARCEIIYSRSTEEFVSLPTSGRSLGIVQRYFEIYDVSCLAIQLIG